MITRITHEIHVFIEWKLYLHYNGSGIHVSQQWIHEFLIFHMWNSMVFWSGIRENNPSSLHALKPWNPWFQNHGIPLSTMENIFLRVLRVGEGPVRDGGHGKRGVCETVGNVFTMGQSR